MDRAMTQDEASVVTWLLDHAQVDLTAYRQQSVQNLRVVGGCSCGCASLYFVPDVRPGKAQILADELAVYPDGQQAGLILWGREGRITWLEVYDCDLGSSHRIPHVSNLRT